MSSTVASSAPKRRWLSCFAAPEGAAGKAACLMVFAAGSSNFNGIYAPVAARDRARSFHVGHVDQSSSYRKVGGTEMLTHFNGWWLFNENGSGTSYYGARVDRSMPPPEVGWHAKRGLNPAPRVQLFDSYEDVPAPLQVPGALERYAVEVFGAGSEDCNGIYHICGIRLGRVCYRREGGLQTILWHRGWWLMNENGSGESRYGFRCPDSPALIPEDSSWSHKLGESPAPSVVTVGSRLACDKAVAVEKPVEHVDYSTADAAIEQCEENPSRDDSLDHAVPMGEPSPCASWLDAGFREMTSCDASSHEANLLPVGLCEVHLHEALHGQLEKLPSEGCSTSDSRTPSEVPEVNPEFENAEIDFEVSVGTHHAGMSQQQALDGQERDPVSDAADEVLAKTMPDSLGAVNILESVSLTPLSPEAHVEPSKMPEVNPEFENAEIDFGESVPTHLAGASQQQALAAQESDPVSDTADEMLATTMPDSLGTVNISESVPLTPLATEAHAEPTEVVDKAPMPCSAVATESQRAVPYMAGPGEDLPAKGFVSQRVKAFVSLSSGKVMSMSATGREAMPDRGMVSERIEAHQRFISKATTSAM